MAGMKASGDIGSGGGEKSRFFGVRSVLFSLGFGKLGCETGLVRCSWIVEREFLLGGICPKVFGCSLGVQDQGGL